VKRGSEVSGNGAVWDMAEFFVIRGYRRRGFGTQVAHELWRRFPGRWEIRVMQLNVTAHRFWARAISRFTVRRLLPLLSRKAGRTGNSSRLNPSASHSNSEWHISRPAPPGPHRSPAWQKRHGRETPLPYPVLVGARSPALTVLPSLPYYARCPARDNNYALEPPKWYMVLGCRELERKLQLVLNSDW
jgi:hypothetical protein